MLPCAPAFVPPAPRPPRSASSVAERTQTGQELGSRDALAAVEFVLSMLNCRVETGPVFVVELVTTVDYPNTDAPRSRL